MKKVLVLLLLTLSLSTNADYYEFTYTSDTYGVLGAFYVDDIVFNANVGSPFSGYLENSFITDLNFTFESYSWDLSDVATSDHTIFTLGSGLPEVQGGAGYLTLAPGMVLYAGGQVSFPGSSLHQGDWSTSSVTSIPSAVPLPAAIWLFGSTLIGLIGIKRKNST